MRYQVIGDTMPAVEVVFDRPGETMYTQSGGMAWMSEGVSMDSNMRGGLGKSIGRMFSGESLFMATYKAEAGVRKFRDICIVSDNGAIRKHATAKEPRT